MIWGASGEGAANGHFNPSKFVLGNADNASGAGTTFSSAINLNGTSRTVLVPFGTSGSGNHSTLSGIISNSTGTAGLIKEGEGRLNLNAANSHNGGTTLQAGTIQLGNAAGLGSTSGQLTINGGLLNLSGQTNVTIGNLTGIGGTIANNASNARTFIIGSGNGTGGNFQGVIADTTTGTGTIALTKTGSGTITLAGSNTYTGATNISGGILVLTGATQATTAIAVSATCTMGLNVASPVTASNAAVSLGGSVQVTGTPTLPSYTLLTASSITGTPVLSPAITGYTLVVEGGNTLKLNSLSVRRLQRMADREQHQRRNQR